MHLLQFPYRRLWPLRPLLSRLLPYLRSGDVHLPNVSELLAPFTARVHSVGPLCWKVLHVGLAALLLGGIQYQVAHT